MKTEKNILIAFILNFLFAIFEFIGGIYTNSVSIISDSVHDIGDSLSIGLSYFLEKKSKKKPDENYTFGYSRYSTLGAIITFLILLIGSILVIINAFKRIFNPIQINYNGMIIFALFGVVVNFIAAYFTKEGDSLNQKSVNLHMLEDVFGWLIVLIGAIIIRFTNLYIIDSILSILLGLFIFIHAFKNFKFILDLFLEKTPSGLSVDELKRNLLKLDNVIDVHHIHLWSMDGINNFATMHVIVKDKITNTKNKIKEELKKHGINHTTIEIEEENENCDDTLCHMDSCQHHHNH